MKIPCEIISGDSASWIDDPALDNLRNTIDSSAWTLNYVIRGPITLNLTAVANGSGWKTTISASDSATLTPGTYYWQAQAVKGSERVTLGAGPLTVRQDLSGTLPNYDGRSQSEKDLDAVQAAMRAMIAGGAVAEYSIAGRSLRKISLPDLMVLESRLKARIAREKKQESIRNGHGNPHNMYVRFS